MTARLLAAWRFRLAGAREARTLLASLTTLAAFELVILSGGGAPAQVSIVSALALSFPFLAWTARQVLDAAPDSQQRLDALALGGDGWARLAGVLAALAVTAPAAALCFGWSLLQVDGDGFPSGVIPLGLALSVVCAAAATAVGAVASRRTVGSGTGPVLVLVLVPVLTALLGASRNPVVTALVPRFGPALRSAYDKDLSTGPSLVLQVAVWSAVVLAVTCLPSRR